ncbi:hypothetical protein AB0L30_36740 [Microbispora rosea]
MTEELAVRLQAGITLRRSLRGRPRRHDQADGNCSRHSPHHA